MDYIINFFPLIFFLIIICVTPVSLEKTNSKRVAKGKPALTELEFIRKVKRERVISVIIVAAATIIATLFREFA